MKLADCLKGGFVPTEVQSQLIYARIEQRQPVGRPRTRQAVWREQEERQRPETTREIFNICRTRTQRRKVSGHVGESYGSHIESVRAGAYTRVVCKVRNV